MIPFSLVIENIHTITVAFIFFALVSGIFSSENDALKHIKIPAIIAASCSVFILYFYFMELFVVYYSGAKYEMEAYQLRWTWPYFWFYALSLIGNLGIALLFVPRLRSSKYYLLTFSAIALMFSSIFSERLLIVFTKAIN